jgi:hypothetical protein
MRFTIELDETDAIAIRVALRQRSRALHSMADEYYQRDPSAFRCYREKANELHDLANRISAVEEARHDTDISALISAPSSPPPSGDSQ